MATKLQCEICGGKLIGKAGGIYECDSCGMEYDTTWVKEKIQQIQGTVKVEGTVEVTGKVQVDSQANKDALIKRANLLLEDGDWDEAVRYGNQVLDMDPECAEAYLIKFLAAHKLHRETDLSSLSIIVRKQSVRDLQEETKAKRLKIIDSVYFVDPSEIDKYLKYYVLSVEARPLLKESDFQEKDFQKVMKYAAPELKQRIEGYKVEAKDKARKVENEHRKKETEFAQQYTARIKTVKEKDKERCIKKRAELAPLFAAARLISNAGDDAVGLRTDGTVCGRENSPDWQGIVSIFGNGYGMGLALKADGTVIGNSAPEWRTIKKVSSRSDHTVGLKADGTVVATGNNDNGQCNVSDWKGIVDIAATSKYTFGLKENGTVVCTPEVKEVSRWSEIVSIEAGESHIVGLTVDGTVVAHYLGSEYLKKSQCDVSSWRNIVAISAAHNHTVGLRENGTVCATRIPPYKKSAIFAGIDIHSPDYNQCKVSDWEDIVAIVASYSITVGLKRDGTVVSTSESEGTKTYNWKLFDRFETIEEEQRTKIKANRMKRLKEAEQNLNQLKTELANLKGLFTGKRRQELERRIEYQKEMLGKIQNEVRHYQELEAENA